MAAYIGSVMNNSVSNTVTIEFSKCNKLYRNFHVNFNIVF